MFDSEKFPLADIWPELSVGLDQRALQAVSDLLMMRIDAGWPIEIEDAQLMVQVIKGELSPAEYQILADAADRNVMPSRRLSYEEKAQLTAPMTSVNDLWPIAAKLGYFVYWERSWAAQMLISHPNYTPEALEISLHELHVDWWGDDPTECRLAMEALTDAQAKHSS